MLTCHLSRNSLSPIYGVIMLQGGVPWPFERDKAKTKNPCPYLRQLASKNTSILVFERFFELEAKQRLKGVSSSIIEARFQRRLH